MKLGLGLRIGRRAVGGGSSFVGPFDGLDATNLFVALCPGHRLFSASDPNVINAVRLSDSTIQDFKATAGSLDLTELVTFSQGSTVRGVTVYDQTGNGHNYTGGANLPNLLVGGSFVALGSGIAMDFGHAAASNLMTLATISLPQPFTVMAVLNLDALTNGRGWFAKTAAPTTWTGTNGTAFMLNAGTTLTGAAAVIGTDYVVASTFDGVNSRLRVNGVNGTPGNGGTNTISAAQTRIGIGVPGFLDGRLGALLIFNGAVSDAVLASYETALASIFGPFP